MIKRVNNMSLVGKVGLFFLGAIFCGLYYSFMGLLVGKISYALFATKLSHSVETQISGLILIAIYGVIYMVLKRKGVLKSHGDKVDQR